MISILIVLNRHLTILIDFIKEGCSTVCKVTSVHTVCDAMNSNTAFKYATEVYKLIRLYLHNTDYIYNK